MTKASFKKMACVGLLALAAAFSGCGSQSKVGVVDLNRLENESPKIQQIQKEITDKNNEIRTRLQNEAAAGATDEVMQQKVAAAQQEQMIYLQSKQKQMQSLVESQCALVAKEKGVGIIMQKRSVPVGAIDVTDDVLAKLNGTAASSSKK